MSQARFLRSLTLLLVLLALTTLVLGVSRAAQGPDIAERLPGGSPVGPLSLERYLPPEEVAPGGTAEDGTPTPPAEQDPQGVYGMDWSRVVFQSARNQVDYNIYIAKPDGSSLQQLTTHAGYDIQPRLNRGATKVVFSSNRDGNWEIYSMNRWGGSKTRLTFHPASESDPCWSPDGQQIAFASDRNGQSEIYVMNQDGSGLKQLTHNGAYDGEPSWSPDGSQIAFASNRTGGHRILVMNADGSGVKILSGEPYSGRPAWSSDGRQITYHADSNSDGWFDIFVMNADGSNRRTIYTGHGTSDYGYDGYAGSWSPDGRYVAYTLVNWVKYKGSWYWQSAHPQAIYISGGYQDNFHYDWDMDWHPDWQSTDISPPISHIYPLPAYSRANAEVTWTAQDVGEAGLEQVLVQYRVGESGDWIKLADSPESYSWHHTFEKQSGETIYFRLRSKDKAGNKELWPAAGSDTQVTFYDWFIGGYANDNHGQAVAGATVLAGPEAFEIHPGDASGYYRAYFKGTDYAFSPSWGKDGYGQLPETTLRTNYDRGFDVVLPPIDNIVADWGFESETLNDDPWQTTGAIAPAVAEAYRHSGGSGVFLGLPFDLETPANVHQANYFQETPFIAGDDSGGLHLLWREASSWDQVIYYAHKPDGGAWSEPLALSGEASNIQQLMWATTDDGRLHVVWKEYDYPRDTIHHIWRNAAGVWSEAQIVHSDGRCLLRHLEVDETGGVHLLWRLEGTDYNDHYYSHADAEGHWDSPIHANVDTYHYIDDLAIGPDGVPHMIWREYQTLYYSFLQNNGVWSSKYTVKSGSRIDLSSLAIDSLGWSHVIWGEGYRNSFGYRQRSPDGTWSALDSIAIDSHGDTEHYSLMMDPEDVLHIAWQGGSEYSCKNLYYLRRDSEGQWSVPTVVSGDDGCSYRKWLHYSAGAAYLLFHSPLRENDIFCSIYLGAGIPAAPACMDSFFNEYPNLVVDRNGIVQTAWKSPAAGGGYDLKHSQSKAATTNDASGVSQQVTIPLTLTNPTLSLIASMQGGLSGSDAKLAAQLDNGSGPVTVLETSEVAAWEQQWADVSAWAGQTVTLTVQVQQATGVPQLGAMLDEVTLGSAPPDLWLDMDGPFNAATGEEFNLTLHYGNRLPSLANGLQISLTLPAEIGYVSADPAPDETTPALIWQLGNLATTDEQPSIVITVTMDADFAHNLWVPLLAELTSVGYEAELANNTAVHSVRVGYLNHLPMLRR